MVIFALGNKYRLQVGIPYLPSTERNGNDWRETESRFFFQPRGNSMEQPHHSANTADLLRGSCGILSTFLILMRSLRASFCWTWLTVFSPRFRLRDDRIAFGVM